MLRRKLHARSWNEIRIRIMRLRKMRVHRVHHRRGVVWPGDGKNCRMILLDQIGLGAEAARHHHLAVLGERLADRAERLFHRGVDEAAGIDDDQIGAGVARRGGVALGAKLGEDALRVDQGLGTAERDETYFRYGHYCLSESGFCCGLGKPGKERPVNMLRAWFCICSWNWANIFWLCSMYACIRLCIAGPCRFMNCAHRSCEARELSPYMRCDCSCSAFWMSWNARMFRSR